MTTHSSLSKSEAATAAGTPQSRQTSMDGMAGSWSATDHFLTSFEQLSLIGFGYVPRTVQRNATHLQPGVRAVRQHKPARCGVFEADPLRDLVGLVNLLYSYVRSSSSQEYEY
jgi:hypothetical protein